MYEETNKTEFHISILRGLKNYHERMLLCKNQCAEPCEKQKQAGTCPQLFMADAYREALIEAIEALELKIEPKEDSQKAHS